MKLGATIPQEEMDPKSRDNNHRSKRSTLSLDQDFPKKKKN